MWMFGSSLPLLLILRLAKELFVCAPAIMIIYRSLLTLGSKKSGQIINDFPVLRSVLNIFAIVVGVCL